MPSTYVVRTTADLTAALAQLSLEGGGTILLEDSGSLFSLSLEGLIFSEGLTITSADAENPARFETVSLSGVENVTIEGVSFEAGLSLSGTTGVSVLNSEVTGGTVELQGAEGTVLSGNSFLSDASALDIQGSTGTQVLGNTFADASEDNVIIIGSIQTLWSDNSVDGAAFELTLIENPFLESAEDLLLKLSFSNDLSDESVYQSQITGYQASYDDEAFVLTGDSKVIIDAKQIYDRQAFTIALDIKVDGLDQNGKFLDMHTAMAAGIRNDGSLGVWVRTKTGIVSLRSETGLIGTEDWHRIAFSFQGGADGALKLFIDGVEVGQADVSSDMIDTGNYDLILGNTWHDSLEAQIDDFEMQAVAQDADWAAWDHSGEPAPAGTPPAPDAPEAPDAGDTPDQPDTTPEEPVLDEGAGDAETPPAEDLPQEEQALLPEELVASLQTVLGRLAAEMSDDMQIGGAAEDLLFGVAEPVLDLVAAAAEVPEGAIVVGSSAELAKAIALLSETGGGTILLENNGEHYDYSGFRVGHTSETITIASLDADNPAMFGTLAMNQSKNFVFDNLKFDGSDAGGAGKVVTITTSRNITVSNSLFEGDSDGFYSGGDSAEVGRAAFMIRNSSGVKVLDNEIAHMGSGMGMIDNRGTVISGNEFHHLTYDGIQMSGMLDTLIENNVMRDFYFTTQNVNHSDMIQLFSNTYNTQNTENLIIRGNVLNSGDGGGSQSIFMRNEAYGETGVAFRNIVVEDNTIYNSHLHGITIADAIGVRVANNTVLWNQSAMIYSRPDSAGASYAPTIRMTNVQDGEIIDNITSGVSAEGVEQSGNVFVNYTQKLADAYLANNFVNLLGSGQIDLRDLRLLADSDWVGKGASSSQPVSSDGETVAVIRQELSEDQPGVVHYDATQSYGPDGALSGVYAYLWTFSDGSTAIGPKVAHRFEEGSTPAATLTVVTETGISVVTREIDVAQDHLVNVDFQAGFADADNPDVSVTGEGAQIVDGALVLDGPSKVIIDTPELYDRQAFSMGVSLKMDAVGEGGTFLNMHTQIGAVVGNNGALAVWVATTDGIVKAVSEVGLMSDTDWHRVSFSFKGGEGGHLTVYLDGEEVAQTDVSAAMVDTGDYPLVLGKAWGDSLKGQLDDLDVLGSAHGADWAADDYGLTFVPGYTGVGDGYVDAVSGTEDADMLFALGQGETLTGDAGADLFTLIESTPAVLDTLADFNAGEGDLILLSAGAFGMSAGQLRDSQFAADLGGVTADTRFYLHEDKLWFDADGAGGADAHALVAFGAQAELSTDSFLLL